MDINQLSCVIDKLLPECYLHPVRLTVNVKNLDLNRIEIREALVDALADEFYQKMRKENPDFEVTRNEWEETTQATTDEMLKKLGLDSLNLDSLAFGPEIKNLTVTSDQTGNNDSRGGGCGFLNLPVEDFAWTVTNPTGITLRNLTEAVYRLKGSKYDFWYELYSDISHVNTVGDHIHMKAEFGYGS